MNTDPNQRRLDVMEFMKTHGVINADWLQPLYGGLGPSSVEKDLRWLRKFGVFRVFYDARRTAYYLPTEKFCHHACIHPSFGKARGELSVAKRVAVAAYCFRYGLERYSSRQFKYHFPKLHHSGACSHYYVDRSEDIIRFGWAEPDCNVNGDTRRLIDKCERIFRQRRRHPEWRKLIDEQRFHVTIVTPSFGKKLIVQARLTERKFFGPVYVEVAEELQHILIQRSIRCRRAISNCPLEDQSPRHTGRSGSGREDRPPSGFSGN